MKYKVPVTAFISETEKKLSSSYLDKTLCNQYAWWILEAITFQKKSDLIIAQTIELTQDQSDKIDDWLDKLINKHMPLQYLIGFVPFNGVTIFVEPPVLIPRPETEEWCTTLIKQFELLQDKNIKILELCTGSGCIALALAKALPESSIIATDISTEALALAEKNARHNNIKNIQVVRSDVYDKIPEEQQFDLIVANPPYIAESEWGMLDTSVKEWEDKQALVADEAGLNIIKRIISDAPARLQSKQEKIPQLIIEIGYTQGQKVRNLFEKAGFIDVQILTDLEKKERVVTGRMPNEMDTGNNR